MIEQDSHEWLEADGLGGFASGTVSMVRTRRYHALLLAATQAPSGRMVLVNGVEVMAKTPAGEYSLTPQRYSPGLRTGGAEVVSFVAEPWPTWVLRLPDGTRLIHELCVTKHAPRCVLRFRLDCPRDGVTLHVRPLMSGRDFHALHRENPAFGFDPEPVGDDGLRWTPYTGVPSVVLRHNGRYTHDPVWYRGFEYDEERARGFDFVEDLASPGNLTFDVSAAAAEVVLQAESPSWDASPTSAAELLSRERVRRAGFPTALDRAADAYVVRRGEGRTIIAGYPWFGDWGRDTFISMRGLCLATGRLDEARVMLLEWAEAVCAGMLPNRFPDRGESPEYNSVDAALWYVIAACELCAATTAAGVPLAHADLARIKAAIRDVLEGYSRGTAYGIGADVDGLLRAGVPGVQLTWMDAKVGGRVITPRHGKPVEVQALWINALRLASEFDTKWKEMARLALRSFRARFWNEAAAALYDVVDSPDGVDGSIRPNQIFAVGGLPFGLLRAEQARAVVDTVERELLTPLGLRSLAPGSSGYCPRYEGDAASRDCSYHQGTTWPWLMGPFVEAWVRVRGATVQAKAEARRRFLVPLMAHLGAAGLGHVSEIADAEAPHRPRGCPFQAWSLGELLRLDRVVLRCGEGEPAITHVTEEWPSRRGKSTRGANGSSVPAIARSARSGEVA